MSGSSGMPLRLQPGLEPSEKPPCRLDLVRPLREAVLLAREDDVFRRHALPLGGRVQLVGLRLGNARIVLALEDECRRLRLGDPADGAGVAAEILVVVAPEIPVDRAVLLRDVALAE